jgi:DNA-binding CsgD family transcriptional regulator
LTSRARLPVPARVARETGSVTERELQVLQGMSQGKSNGQIGRELYVAEDTVKTHARRIRVVSTRPMITMIAQLTGLSDVVAIYPSVSAALAKPAASALPR